MWRVAPHLAPDRIGKEELMAREIFCAYGVDVDAVGG